MAEEQVPPNAQSDDPSEPLRTPFMPTRRQWLIGAGVTLGAAFLARGPLGDAVAALSRVVRPAVGVVAPPSARYPDLLGQLVAGVERGLIAGGQADAPVFSRAAAGSAPSAVAASAAELIERDRVSLVLAYANPTQTGLLGDLAETTGVPIVVVDPGAHIVTSADTDSRVLSHSLGYWQSAWALGSWSATDLGGRTFVISSLYESGFDILNAFSHGTEHGGGSIVGTAITHRSDGDITEAIAAAADSGADAIFVAASGAEAGDIVAALAADRVASKLPLLLPGLGTGALASARKVSALTASTWPFAEKSAFEMLGEDIGALVADAVVDGATALPAGDTEIAGERGQISLDLATGRTDAVVSIRQAHGQGGLPAFAVKPEAEYSTADASRFADAIVPKLRTGWLDVYGSQL